MMEKWISSPAVGVTKHPIGNDTSFAKFNRSEVAMTTTRIYPPFAPGKTSFFWTNCGLNCGDREIRIGDPIAVVVAVVHGKALRDGDHRVVAPDEDCIETRTAKLAKSSCPEASIVGMECMADTGDWCALPYPRCRKPSRDPSLYYGCRREDSRITTTVSHE